jgi:glutamate-ammonia-ligase adenylyltransferase
LPLVSATNDVMALNAIPLFQAIRRVPKAGRIGRARLKDLLAEEEASGLQTFAGAHSAVAGLLEGIAEGSPYLWRLVQRSPPMALALLEHPLEASLAGISQAMAEAGRTLTLPAAMKVLRQQKSRHALLVAMADLSGILDVVGVTGSLSDFADDAVKAALRIALRVAGEELTVEYLLQPERGLGLFVLALGKHGARELNYSSDIDLACFYDPEAPALAGRADHLDRMVAIVKLVAQILSHRNADGYVLRVDLRLRPDPGTTPIAMPVNAALAYYETVGQNWERAAMIKARIVAGDEIAGARYLTDLQPFIWRKYFDYGAIADIHAMKRQIYAVKGHDQVAIAGHDLKLGRGGIREIEFFVQTQQLVYGGRRSSLRGARTLDMLEALARETWITPQAACDLSEAYVFLRMLEHRVQMIEDEQTQKLPRSDDDLLRLARFCGMTRSAFDRELIKRLKQVEHHYARLFEGGADLASGAGSLVFAGVETEPETRDTLKRLGFRNPEMVAETVRGWHFGRRSAVTTPRAREVLTELVPGLLESFSRASDPDGAIVALDGALQRMPAAVELFTILHSNASLRQLFAECLGTAPRLSQMVAQSPHVLDVLVDPDFANVRASPMTRIAPRLEREHEYELFLERARHLHRGEHFLMGTRILSRLIPAAEIGSAQTQLAECVLALVFERVRAEFTSRHGKIAGAEVSLVGYGKAGSHELTAASDLDLVVIYSADEDAWSDGAKALMTSEYFAKLTQRLVAALSAPMRAGTLYEVDLRLRPSGKKGPVAASIGAFAHYFEGEADFWEHLALSRARVLIGDGALVGQIRETIARLIAVPRDERRVRAETADMRGLMAREKPGRNKFDVKDWPGGLIDIEFIAQSLALRFAGREPRYLVTSTRARLTVAGETGDIPAEAVETLLISWDLQLALQQVSRVLLPGPLEESAVSAELLSQIARLLDYPGFAMLSADLTRYQGETRALFEQLIGKLQR